MNEIPVYCRLSKNDIAGGFLARRLDVEGKYTGGSNAKVIRQEAARAVAASFTRHDTEQLADTLKGDVVSVTARKNLDYPLDLAIGASLEKHCPDKKAQEGVYLGLESCFDRFDGPRRLTTFSPTAEKASPELVDRVKKDALSNFVENVHEGALHQSVVAKFRDKDVGDIPYQHFGSNRDKDPNGLCNRDLEQFRDQKRMEFLEEKLAELSDGSERTAA